MNSRRSSSIMSSVVYFDKLSVLADREATSNSVRVSARTLLSAYKHFLKETAVYLAGLNDENEVETAKELLSVCPEALKYEFEGEGLLIHSVSKPVYVTLYSSVGREYGVGGDDGRGGLLDEDPYEECNKLQSIACDKVNGLETFQSLLKTSPPLFFKGDVERFALLHRAAYSGNIPMAKFLLDLDPPSITYLDERHLPIEESVFYGKLEMFKFLLQKGIERNIPCGGLFKKVDDKKTTLEVAMENIGIRDTFDCIESVFSSIPNPPPIIHEIIRNPSLRGHLSDLLSRFPECIMLRDGNNRLPIHVALDEGLTWSLELIALLGSNSESVQNEVDPVTSMHPFMLAASGPTPCDLRTIFHLVQKNPQHVVHGIKQRRQPGGGGESKETNESSSEVKK